MIDIVSGYFHLSKSQSFVFHDANAHSSHNVHTWQSFRAFDESFFGSGDERECDEKVEMARFNPKMLNKIYINCLQPLYTARNTHTHTQHLKYSTFR